MRRGKKPTRKQKIRLGQAGLAPENWLVVKQKANGELAFKYNILEVEVESSNESL